MRIIIKTEKKVEVKFLQVKAEVRYWEDAFINGEQDNDDGDLIPCREGDYWKPKIDIQTGQILNWVQGKTANIHYKVCDRCECSLLSETDTIIKTIEGYVPKIMYPKRNGYGDYIIMDIDENGFIQNWKPDLSDFEN